LKNGDTIFKIGGILDRLRLENNQLAIKGWINGTTKEPFVNANMIELRETGFMSKRQTKCGVLFCQRFTD
jgi:deoxyribodipyrimidine photo-lyase